MRDYQIKCAYHGIIALVAAETPPQLALCWDCARHADVIDSGNHHPGNYDTEPYDVEEDGKDREQAEVESIVQQGNLDDFGQPQPQIISGSKHKYNNLLFCEVCHADLLAPDTPTECKP